MSLYFFSCICLNIIKNALFILLYFLKVGVYYLAVIIFIGENVIGNIRNKDFYYHSYSHIFYRLDYLINKRM